MTIPNPNLIASSTVTDMNVTPIAAPAIGANSLAKDPLSIDQFNACGIGDMQPPDDPLEMKNESSAEYTTGDETDSKQSPSNHTEGLVYKLTVRDGKQILAKVNDISQRKSGVASSSVKSSDSDESAEHADKERSRSKSSSGTTERKTKDGKSREQRDKEKSTSNGSSSKDGKSRSDRDKERKSTESSAHKSSSKSSSSSRHGGSSSSSDKNKDKSSSSKSSSSGGHKSSSSSSSSSHKSGSKSSAHKSSSSSSSSRDKHKSSSSSSKSSSKDREKKDVDNKASQADKDKATLAKVLPPTMSKMAKIPKKSATEDGSADGAQAKKSSISIEVRKDCDSRPKTVKTFNSQFRSHGLAEEAPPPPSRRGLKKPAIAAPEKQATANNSGNTTASAASPTQPKRSLSPTTAAKETIAVDKKIKLETPVAEKPGAIKLIPAKPKRKYIYHSNQLLIHISFSSAVLYLLYR